MDGYGWLRMVLDGLWEQFSLQEFIIKHGYKGHNQTMVTTWDVQHKDIVENTKEKTAKNIF